MNISTFALFISILLCSCICFEYDPNISYQLHSFNDRREWKSLIKKQTARPDSDIWWKLDINYADPGLASMIPTCKDPVDKGCLVLTHNSPTKGVSYSTPEDLFTFLTDTTNSQFFHNPSQQTYLAFCFKYSDPCDGWDLKNDTTTQNWMTLVDQMMDDGKEIIQDNNLSVSFIIDGSATPGGSVSDVNKMRLCLKSKWEPWASTFVSTRDPEGAIKSSDSEYGYDRFQVLNEPSNIIFPPLYFDLMKGLGYGKFQELPYPFLVWEPNFQDAIELILDSYLDGIKHPKGIRFAINFDPLTYQVFTANQTGLGWNNQLLLGYDKPLMVDVSRSGSQSVDLLILAENPNKNYDLILVQSSQIFRQITRVKLLELSTQSAFTSFSSSQLDENTHLMMLVKEDGEYLIMKLDKDPDSLKLIMKSKFSNLPSYTEKLCSAKIIDSEYLIETFKNETHIIIQTFKYNFDSSSYQFTITQLGSPISVYKEIVGETITDIDISAEIDYPNNGVSSSLIMNYFLIISNEKKKIYAILDEINLSQERSLNSQEHVTLNPYFIGYGQHGNSDIIKDKNGQSFILYTHTHGTCWNNEPDNKNENILVCDQVPDSYSNIINYAFGTIQDWKSFIVDSEILNPCHQKLTVGTFSLGDYPKPILLIRDEIIYLVVAHSGIPFGFVDTTACGSPKTFEGIMLDGIRLPNWTIYNQDQI
ncbi:hypothetical protein M0813_14747 [Anaeramoeba flamelloides]|uniref:Uncharacterized protein n=1 Tax=Anaeramoeba flamelloides TaxID=1746091 RepID=A0ABQ8Z512_9EUKA|nr:hypothetical protein M0813_14747 [Anaeramoeba flamelloides]